MDILETYQDYQHEQNLEHAEMVVNTIPSFNLLIVLPQGKKIKYNKTTHMNHSECV